MLVHNWLCRAGALGAVGALAAWATVASADDPKPESVTTEIVEIQGSVNVNTEPGEQPDRDVLFIAADDANVSGELILTTDKPSEYWLGVECHPVDEAMRTQLGLQGNGLIVEQILPESPAAKSEIKRFDVLLSVNDKQLKDVKDLISVLEETKDKELRLKALRSGKEVSIAVTPAKRPENQLGGEHVGRLHDYIVRRIKPGNGEPLRQPLRMQFLHPGVVLPPGAPARGELPDDISISVRKEGKKPATIEVKRGDKNWTTSEDKLGELPDDVRGPVEGWLGRGPGPMFNIKLPEANEIRTRVRQLDIGPPRVEAERHNPPREGGRGDGPRPRVVEQPQPPVERQPRVTARIAGDANARIEQQLQAMAEKLSEMNRDLQELRQQRRPDFNRIRERDRRDRDEREERDRGDRDRGPRERDDERPREERQ